MELKLPNSIATPVDIDEIVLDLESYAQWFAQASIKLKGDIALDNPPKVSKSAIQLVNQNIGTEVTNKKLDKLINSLLDMKDDSPRITITLAALPNNNVKTRLIEWCRQNIADTVLVELKHDRRILGGMIVQSGSHIHDWSFKSQISQQADQLTQVLQNV